MGTWGTALYADDTALDLRDEWGTRMRWGGKAEAVTDELTGEYGAEDTTVWLVLADIQWRCGHLAPVVRAKALEIIESGADLGRWKEASATDQHARLAVLRKLRAKLESPPPPPKTYAPPRSAATPMKLGQVYSWRLLDGRYTFVQVCGMCTNLGVSPAPSIRVLDLVSQGGPSLAELAALPSRKAIRRFEITEKAEPTFLEHPQAAFGTFGPAQYPKSRLKRLGVLPIPSVLDNKRKVIGSSWLGADELFATMYGIGWWVGDVVAWKREGAPPILLSIASISTIQNGGISEPFVTVEVLDWVGPDIPTSAELSALAPIVPQSRSTGSRLSLAGLPPGDRVQHLGRVARERTKGPAHVFRWTELDGALLAILATAKT